MKFDRFTEIITTIYPLHIKVEFFKNGSRRVGYIIITPCDKNREWRNELSEYWFDMNNVSLKDIAKMFKIANKKLTIYCIKEKLIKKGII